MVSWVTQHSHTEDSTLVMSMSISSWEIFWRDDPVPHLLKAPSGPGLIDLSFSNYHFGSSLSLFLSLRS